MSTNTSTAPNHLHPTIPSLPQTYTSYHRPLSFPSSPSSSLSSVPSPSTTTTTTNPFSLQARTLPLPPPASLGPHQVLLKIFSVSLNYRDAAILKGTYVNQAAVVEGGVPCSDAAGVVVALGEKVRGVKVGSRVVTMVGAGFGEWPVKHGVDGEEEATTGASGEGRGEVEEEEVQSLTKSLGAEVDGVLREYAVLDERSLVPFPEYLGFDEASTLPGAGLTAWNSLRLPLLQNRKSASVLLQGTGGVSLFSLLLALAVPKSNITPIISSSSPDKLARVQSLGPEGVVKGYNYRSHPDQASQVQLLTNGRGVDIVVNNTGPASIPSDIASLKFGDGRIALVGFLEGLGGDWNPAVLMGLIGKRASLEGILCGTRSEILALNKFLEERKVDLSPVVDRVFGYGDKEVKEALEYLWEGKHVGKVVIRVADE